MSLAQYVQDTDYRTSLTRKDLDSESPSTSRHRPRELRSWIGQGRAGRGRAGQGGAGRGRAGQRRAGRGTWKWDVDGGVLCSCSAHFCQLACAGVGALLVAAHKQDAGIIVEDVMRAVAMMYIVVKNHHLHVAALLLRPVLSKAKGHCVITVQ